MSTNSIIPADTPDGNSFSVFNFNGMEVRARLDDNANPIFIAGDVCKALELDNITRALSNIPEDEKGFTVGKTLGGLQNLLCISESGLYRLIFRSNKPEAEKFRLWVFNEVLPSIRKTGSYIAPDLSPMQILKQMFSVIENQDVRIDNLDNRVQTLEAHVQPETEYFSALGYFRYRNITAPSMNEVQALGQRASRLSKERGLSIGKIADPRFGSVNTYHIAILDELVKG